MALFEGIVEREGGIDVVFANAGITAGPGFLATSGERDPKGAIENIPDELWERVLSVNLHGVFKTIQAAVPHLKKRGGGRIIVTTSTAATKTSPMVGTPYLATKGGGGASGSATRARACALQHHRECDSTGAVPDADRLSRTGAGVCRRFANAPHRSAGGDRGRGAVPGVRLHRAS